MREAEKEPPRQVSAGQGPSAAPSVALGELGQGALGQPACLRGEKRDPGALGHLRSNQTMVFPVTCNTRTPLPYCSYSFSCVTDIVADNPTVAAFDVTEVVGDKTELLNAGLLPEF